MKWQQSHVFRAASRIEKLRQPLNTETETMENHDFILYDVINSAFPGSVDVSSASFKTGVSPVLKNRPLLRP